MIPRRTGYEKELYSIFDKLALMLNLAETNLQTTTQALTQRDTTLAAQAIEAAQKINKLERKTQKAILKLFITQHPVARDFRELTAALKMTTDLARIGDQTRDIAEITTKLQNFPLGTIATMAETALQMLQEAIQAYTNKDLTLATNIETTDDMVDQAFETAMGELTAHIQQSPENASTAITLTLVAKYFERIADHTVNIGQWVAYGITGKYPKKAEA